MAELTLIVGNLTATKTATDVNAAGILRGMLESDGYDLSTMTNQQQADAVIDTFVNYANNKARINEQRKATEAVIAPVFE